MPRPAGRQCRANPGPTAHRRASLDGPLRQQAWPAGSVPISSRQHQSAAGAAHPRHGQASSSFRHLLPYRRRPCAACGVDANLASGLRGRCPGRRYCTHGSAVGVPVPQSIPLRGHARPMCEPGIVALIHVQPPAACLPRRTLLSWRLRCRSTRPGAGLTVPRSRRSSCSRAGGIASPVRECCCLSVDTAVRGRVLPARQDDARRGSALPAMTVMGCPGPSNARPSSPIMPAV
jgi:hypothetical protein